MKDLINELDMALAILGSLPVTHDAQEAIVSAKHKIRKVKAELEKEAADNG